jgi:hypothetical protein
MAISKDNSFVIRNYLEQSAQRDGTLDQVPFALAAMRGNPKSLRIFLEAVLAKINWTVTTVANSDSYVINGDDVVILSGHSATLTLPSIDSGRIIVIKDKSGAAATSGQAITVNRNSTDTIDGANTSLSLGANYGAIILVGDAATSPKVWYSIALV